MNLLDEARAQLVAEIEWLQKENCDRFDWQSRICAALQLPANVSAERAIDLIWDLKRKAGDGIA